jgi:hypothetical protein
MAIARLFRALSKNHLYKEAHSSLHLDISSNSIESFDQISLAIRDNHGPSSLTCRFLDFEESFQFEQFMRALSENKIIQFLDLSQLFLEFHLDENSIDAMLALFSRNNSLRQINLSAQSSRLEDFQFGSKIHEALHGLSRNTSLEILRIEGQAIGPEGASTLAEVLRANTTLREVHCENNNMNLANFTLLVDALQTNTSVTFLSSMESNKSRHVHSIESSIIKPSRPKEQKTWLDINITPFEKDNLSCDVIDAIGEVGTVVEEHWNFQRRRLEQILHRNLQLAYRGIISPFEDSNETTTGANEDEADCGLPPLEVALSEFGFDV